MRKSLLFIALLCLTFNQSCKEEVKKDKGTTKVMTAKKIKMSLEPKSESTVTGTVAFTEEDNGEIRMVAMLEGLESGTTHAMHIHEKADCSSPDGKSSGGHWNPTFNKHGKWGDENGYHKGDIGNFEVDENGNGAITMETNEWCIDCEDESKNIIGKAVIVHQGTDDLTSQPSGAAGSRIICGAILQ